MHTPAVHDNSDIINRLAEKEFLHLPANDQSKLLKILLKTIRHYFGDVNKLFQDVRAPIPHPVTTTFVLFSGGLWNLRDKVAGFWYR